MTNLTHSILMESAAARAHRMNEVGEGRELELLNKAKALQLSLWEGKLVATIQEVADFYEVSFKTVQGLLVRNKEEFDQDSSLILNRKQLDSVTFNLKVTRATNRLRVLTVRSVMRIGFILQDSPVAAVVRNLSLDILSAKPVIKKRGTYQDSQHHLERTPKTSRS